MDNTTLKNGADIDIQQELTRLIDEIKAMCVKKFKEEHPKIEKIDFDPTLEQLYFLANSKSQVNNISGMVIEILNSDNSVEQKLQLVKERYDFAVGSLQ